MGFMKTEQEQIEQIEQVLKYSVADYKHLKKKGVCYCYAETLIDHGYGDVSEYKAEIERLKANGYRSIMYAFENNRDKIVENIQTEIDDYKQSIKQAQIDILNKAKERLDSAPNGWAYTTYIDELIEEVQNAEDKG